MSETSDHSWPKAQENQESTNTFLSDEGTPEEAKIVLSGASTTTMKTFVANEPHCKYPIDSIIDLESTVSQSAADDPMQTFVIPSEDTSQIEINADIESEISHFATVTSVELIETTTTPEDQSQLIIEPDDSITIVAGNESVNENCLFKSTILELGRYIWKTTGEKQCFTKGCLWSPDGTCCLVPVNLDGMHLIELPTDLYEGVLPQKRLVTCLSTAIHIKEGGTVYDCAWYPFMNSINPESCCWLASRQHEPIHMWDAYNGEIRATYRGYDDVEEVEAAISVIFSSDGSQVLGGYKKCIRVFDTEIPGRKSTKLATKQAISCFALAADNSEILTTGSWNGVINLYDKRVPAIGSLSALFGHTGGITYLKYSNSGEILFSGARKDDRICLWDMRNFSEPMTVLNRSVATNQRIYFDLSPQNEWLISGDTSGTMRVWSLNDIEQNRAYRLHRDSCNGVNFHPTKPIIATTAGQYHFANPDEDGSEIVIEYENSLVFWWIGSREVDESLTTIFF